MELLFVYNANADVISQLVDYVHKVLKPSTYRCALCALRHHNLGERKNWKKFKQRSKSKLSFHYIRAFEKEFNESYDYPVVLVSEEDQRKVVFDKQMLKEMKSVDGLITVLENYMRTKKENDLL
ncbi:MAG: GTPase [Crocinitomicaceae bacterium]|nr:GTPase [Crocinitomicaceae bacterium]